MAIDMSKFQMSIPVPTAATGAVSTGFQNITVQPQGVSPFGGSTQPATGIVATIQPSSPDSNLSFRPKQLDLAKLTDTEQATMAAAFAIFAATYSDGRAV